MLRPPLKEVFEPPDDAEPALRALLMRGLVAGLTTAVRGTNAIVTGTSLPDFSLLLVVAASVTVNAGIVAVLAVSSVEVAADAGASFDSAIVVIPEALDTG